jgi:ABC-type multidrug transport system ATPase subunit
MGDDVILRTSGLGKRFGARWAVRDLDLEVRRGEIFGFLGPNGAGKSTTIRMIMTLVHPTRGTVELFGRPHGVRRRTALSRVGSLVERADFYLHLSARRNLEIIAGVRGPTPTGELERVLRIAGLDDRADDPVKTFSHGMKQRLGIAQALLGSPELIVLDEPTTGLDPQGMKEVRELVVRLAREEGTTVFLSSHLLHEIEQVATTLAIIHEGRLAAQGRVADLLAGKQVRVRIEVTPASRAGELLSTLPYVVDPAPDAEGLDVVLPREKLAEVNRLLVQAGLEVRGLIPRRSLEDLFLSITGGT